MPCPDAWPERGDMMFSGDKPSWRIEGRGWPNRDFSRFVTASGLNWHVQVAGDGPEILLLHGTGAATHSWRGMLPLLTRDFRVIAPDLPGHGFTDSPARRHLTLPGMAAALAGLMTALDARPVYAVGHSAGAAILAHMYLSGALQPQALISINGALLPFRGRNGPVYSFLAKALSLNPLTPRIFAWQTGKGPAVERLMAQVGSSLDAEGLDFYRRLLARSGHVATALNMMANWDLEPLTVRLPKLTLPVTLIAGARDGAIPLSETRRLQGMLPDAELVELADVGHLAHEESPEEVAGIIAGMVIKTCNRSA